MSRAYSFKSAQKQKREDLQKRFWPADVYVDFEASLNAAVKRLRAALGDPADTPRFVETLSRRGYRFVAPISLISEPPAQRTGLLQQRPRRRSRFCGVGA